MKHPCFRAAAPAIALVTTCLSVVCWWVFPPEQIGLWMNEGALVEDVTILLYLVASGLLLLGARRVPRGIALALAVTMAAFAAREAHWHIDFTGTSMLRVSYYLRPAPAMHKLVSLAVIAAILAAWVYLSFRGLRAWRSGRMAGGVLATNIVTFLVLLAMTKLMDRVVSIAAEDFDLFVGPAARALQLVLEEPLEMMLPVVLLAAAWQYRTHTEAVDVAPASLFGRVASLGGQHGPSCFTRPDLPPTPAYRISTPLPCTAGSPDVPAAIPQQCNRPAPST